MQIQKDKSGELSIISKKATIFIDGQIRVNEVELDGAGEYEIGGISVLGIDDDTYIFQLEELSLGYANFKKKITKEDVEKLSSIEVLIVRLDGDVSTAVEQAGQIEPVIVIYSGSNEAEGKLKEAGVSFENLTTLKVARSDVESAEPKAYFVETSNGDAVSEA